MQYLTFIALACTSLTHVAAAAQSTVLDEASAAEKTPAKVIATSHYQQCKKNTVHVLHTAI